MPLPKDNLERELSLVNFSYHLQLNLKVIQSGHDSKDALPYQVKAIKTAIIQTSNL